MRTTIDIPDRLLQRVKRQMIEQNTTFRDMVISALEKTLSMKESGEFKLRDAAVGKPVKSPVSNDEINEAIDQQRC